MSFDFALPLRQPDSPTETIIFLVEWGDGQSEVMTLEGGNNWNPAIYTHSYATDEAKTIKIYPLIGETFGKYWNFGSGEVGLDRLKLKGITQWGAFQFDRSGGAFEGCSNLSFSSAGGTPSFGPAGDPPNSPNNALARAFKGCSSLSPNTNAFTDWNTTNVNSLSETFSGCLNLNVNLGNWNVSNVRTTYRMFYNCTGINQSFAGWTDVSNLENMSEMFSGATNFAGEIFANWDSKSFADYSDKTSSDISGMFKGTKFNGANVSTWDVSNISNFSSVFEGATLFNGNIDDWDTGEGTNFYNMFNGATSFNRNISQWDTSKGTNFNSMFEGATIFNQNINTGAEINKHGGLYNPWTIRSDVAVTMDNMLNGASAFDQDISDWDVTNISSATNLLTGANLSVANALEINDSSTGWPSQGGASAAVTNESAAAVQASGTIPYWTSYDSGGTEAISNPENTQTVVNLTATGSPTPAFSLTSWGDDSKFTLDDNGDGTATLKLTAAPDFENPTDLNGNNNYDVAVKASNSIGESQPSYLTFNVTNVADIAAPAVSNAGIPAGNEPSPTWAYFGWTSAGEGVKYKYQLASDAGFTSLLMNQSSGSHTPTYVTTAGYGTLSPETTYYFRVRAAHGAAYEVDGPWTTWSIVTADATFAPTWVDRGSGATVTQLIDQSSNPNQWYTYYDNDENTIETVYFEAAGTPTPSFSIKTGTGAYDGGMFTLVDHGNGTGLIKLTNPLDFENLPWNSFYGKNFYSAVVVAENTHSNSSTIETRFSLFPKNVPDVVAPTVTSQPTTNLTSTSFFINWSSVGSDVRYTYEFASDSGFNSILKQDNDYGGIYVTTSGAGLTLTPETTYYFRVKANGGGVGSTYEVDGPWTTWSIVTPEAPELGVSTSYNWLSDATDGSGNPQPHLIPDFSTPTATLVAPAEYASDVYAGNHHYTSHYYQFGSGGTAIDGGVCAVIAPMGDNYPGYSNGEQTTPYGQVFIYERSGGAWSYSTSFGGIPGNPNWAPFNSDDSSSLNIHLGGADSTTGSALAVHNGRVFVASGGSEKSIYIFSKDAGTWSLEARITGYQGSTGSLIDAGEDLTAPHYSNVSLSVHGGIIAMGLHRAPGDLGHNPTNMWRGIVAVYVAPSKDEFISGARGQTVPWTYWMSPGAYATDHPEFGYSVAAHDGRASGGQSVIVAGVGDTNTTASTNRNSHYYFLGTPSASFNSSFGIVDPSGVIGTGNEGSYADKYYAKTQSSLCGWGNDITLLASQGWADGLSDQERLYQLDPAGGSWGFSFMQYINSHWGENNIFGSPETRGYATILADRLIVASANPSSTSSPIRKVWMREQTGAGGTSQAIAQGDYFMDGFDGGLPHLSPSGGSIDGGGVNSVDSDNADFEGYVNFHGDLSSYWTANQSSLESTYGNKRGWGEAHWYQSGIKEGREMKYQLTTYDYDLGVKIYEA